jgi:dTDP-4-dehydrorhamnose 3,5-epimerase
MSAPVKDKKTVGADGDSAAKLPVGVSFHDVTTHVDERGSLVELYDLRWGWHGAPLVFAYAFTIRPGMIKGWAVHEKHDDRYFIMSGEIEVVLYDEREGSATKGLVAKVVMTEYRRRLMSIPIGVWHAVRNIGSKDAMAINFPTTPYEHEDPDKFRLPVDTDKIPYKFENPRGG